MTSLLVSVINVPAFLRNKDVATYAEWVLDSGAFSAMNSGRVLTVEWYIKQCEDLMLSTDAPTEVFALDVIGDLKATMSNVESMWNAGIEAIPTVHYGTTTDEIKTVANAFPKIALGGLAGRLSNTNHGQRLSKTQKLRWVNDAFAAVWPKRVHGFGCTDETMLASFPFETVDSTSWYLQPSRYGLWKTYKRLRHVRGSAVTNGMKSQIDYCLRVERRVRAQWAKVVATHGLRPFAYRFATSGAVNELKAFAEGN